MKATGRIFLGLLTGLSNLTAAAVSDPFGPSTIGFPEAELKRQIALLETNLTQIVDDLAMVAPDPLAGGVIWIWSGSASTVPTGWALCDGANGTPDLRNRFVQAAASAGEVGERGEATTHTHTAAGHVHPIPALGHMHSIDTVDDIRTEYAGDHTHEVGTATGGSIHVDQLGFGGEFVAAKGHDHTLMAIHPWQHRHLLSIPGHATIGTDSSASTSNHDSTGESADHLPPYYALCFLMKLPEKEPVGWSPQPGLDLSGRVSALSESTAPVHSLLKSTVSNSVPDGLIAFWSGLTEAVPESWVVCDGNHGTPDLRNRFVLGAVGSSEVGEDGGSISHTHATHAHQHQVTMPSHSHAILAVSTSTAISGAHTHTLGHATGIKNTEVGNDRYDQASLAAHSHILSLAGAHSHSLELPGTTTERKGASGWAGLADSTLRSRSHLPPFEKLRHLMKTKSTGSVPAISLASPTAPLANRVDALEKAWKELSTAVNRTAPYAVPVGTIAVWRGTSETIPSGWVPCDGRSDTPNLCGRFIRGAATEAGSIGGATEHNHSLGTHTHTVFYPHSHEHRSRALRTLTVADSEHSILDYETRHTHSFAMLCEAASDLSIGGGFQVATELHGHDLLEGGEAHEHNVTVDQPLVAATDSLFSDSSESTYASYPAEHLPPYRKLLFIMRTDDTAAASATIAGPNTIAAGQVLAASLVIPNLSTTLASGVRIGRAFLSKDSDYDPASDRLLGQVVFNPNQLVAGNYTVKQDFAIPEVPPGHYYLVIQIESDKLAPGTPGTNMFHSAAIGVQAPDLSPTKLDAPSVIDAGQTLTATWTVANLGGAPANPSWVDHLYLSSDAVYSSSSDRYLGRATHDQVLVTKGVYTASLKFTLPDLPPGLYYLIVQADHYNAVYEAAETNQYRAMPIQIRVPDLSPTSLAGPKLVEAGQETVASWTVVNRGNTEARPSWHDHLYLSTNTVFNSSADRLLGSVTHEQALAESENYSASLKFTMPDVPSGLYYLILRVDHYDTVYESDEKNNVLTLPLQLGGTKPVQLTLPNPRTKGRTLPEISMASAAPTTARVEFSLNGQILGTAYGAPFTLEAASLSASAQSALFAAQGEVSAGGFDSMGSLVCQASMGLGESHEGFPTRLEIDQPYANYTIYTDDTTAPSHTMLIRAYASRQYLSTVESETGHSSGWTHDVPLTNGQFQVQFAIDGTVRHTSTNGLPGDPFYHEFEFNTRGLEVGNHRVSVRLVHPEGFWDASDARSFVVEQRHPDLRVQRDVYAESNHFRVTLTLHNDGSGPATLHRLRETMTGFQACRVLTSLPLDTTTTTFSFADRQCTLEFDFGDVTILADSYRTLSYRAVPILFQSDCDYVFGGNGEVTYENDDGVPTTEPVDFTTTTTSPWASRLAVATAVDNAIRSSDYLLVTSPINLERAYSAADAAPVLTDMADLATRRNGVLGYFHGSGLIRSRFRTDDLLALGNFFSTEGAKDEVFVGRIADDSIYAYAENRELTLEDVVPVAVDLRAGDSLVVGNFKSNYETGTNDHRTPEFIVAFGSGHDYLDCGKILVHQYAYSTNTPWTVHELSSGYSTGARLAIGEIWDETGNARDEIVVARTNGTIVGYCATGAWTLATGTAFRAGDHFAVGDLIPYGCDELVVGGVGGGLTIYNFDSFDSTGRYPEYQRAQEVSLVETLEAEDGFAVGDVMGDGYAEIVIAYASRDEIRIYGYDATSSSFERVGKVEVAFDPSDRLAVGYFGSSDKAQIVIAHGAEATFRQAGTLEFFQYVDGVTPGSARALDRLIDREGAWATRLATNWVDDGYLLIVGENEIIPTFSKTWDLYNNDAGRVDYTDRNYASTDSSSENCLPELAVGRIVGNSAARLDQALLTAISLASDPRDLNNSNAYCVSGSDPDDDDEFVPIRDSIADKLRDRGFDVLEQHAPNAATFYTNASRQDVIFLAGHGSPSSWCDPTITGDNVASDFNPGNAFPLVYVSSCQTGRYPDGLKTLSEQFLNHGAVVFIGSTENSLVSGDFGWGRRIGQTFFDRVEADRPLGYSLKLAKRRRLSDAANSYAWDWNYNRFTCATYQYYGDPKAEIHWLASGLSLAAARANRGDAFSQPIAGPVSELPLRVPMFQVASRKSYHQVEIPGGEMILVPGQPMVPFYAAVVRFPQGQVVQKVTLKARSGLHSTTGLILPPAVPKLDADAASASTAYSSSGWWPDRDFDWSLTENPDGSRDLTLKAYAFAYHADTTEARFYSNYVFGITWIASPVNITRLATESPVYPAGALVKANLTVQNSGTQPIDVVAEATILRNESDIVEKLPAVPMPSLKTVGWTQFPWDTTNRAGGDYVLEVRLQDTAGRELDRARTEFQVGQANGAITSFNFKPRDYRIGDNVSLSATFANTGSTSLDGDVIIVVQDAGGQTVTEFRQAFSALAPGAAFRFAPVWPKASLGPNECQFLVYAQYGGQTTALSVFANPSETPLMWTSIAVSATEVQLTWPSTAGRLYLVDFTPELGTIPFSGIASNLVATPPQNTFVDSIRHAQGFYRLREER